MTDTAFDFESAEVTEVNDRPFDGPPMPAPDLACVVCGRELVYGGRGPKPKYCADHKKSKGSTGSTRPKKTKNGTDYTEGIAGLLQLPTAALFMAGTAGKEPNLALIADANAIAVATPKIAVAVSDLANERPEIAAVLDKILKVGPYGALLTAVVPMVAQILTNHKIIPAGVAGTKSAEDYLKEAYGDAEGAAA